MDKPAPVLENDMHKILCDFNIQTDHLIPARRPDLINKKKKKEKRIFMIVDFAVPAGHRIKLKECEKKDKYLDLARKIEKAVEHESDDCTNCNWRFWQNNKKIIKSPGGLGSWQMSRDYSNDSITENGQNTEKSLGDLWRLAVTQTPVKYHKLKLMWKTVKE